MNFNVMDLIKHYFKKIFSNLLVFVLVFLLGLCYISKFHETKYVADTTFMIGACFHDCEEEAHLNVDFNKKVLFDYMELIKSNRVLKKANDISELKYSSGELSSMVSVSYEEDTEYVRISVVSKNEKDGPILAYNIINALSDEIERIFDVNNIYLVDYDLVGHEKTSTKKLIIYIIIIGFIVTIIKSVIGFLFFPKKNKIEDKVSIEDKKETVSSKKTSIKKRKTTTKKSN